MHPVKHKAMMQQLTRPGTPEQAKKAEENNKKYLADRRAKTLKSYGLTEKDLKPAAMDPQTLKPGNTFNDIGRNFLIEESKSRDLSSEEIQYLKNDEIFCLTYGDGVSDVDISTSLTPSPLGFSLKLLTIPFEIFKAPKRPGGYVAVKVANLPCFL